MLKDFFQESNEAVFRLRSEYFKINDYLEKGQHRMKKNYFSKQHYDFDINSQQYFHERLDEIVFQKPDIQEDFYQHIYNYLQFVIALVIQNLQINSQTVLQSSTIEQDCKIIPQNTIKKTKQKLILHFESRQNTLVHKKYLTILRFHNNVQPTSQNLKVLNNRIKLLDAQIQSTISRLTRLKTPDDFGIATSKPIPVNQNQNATYKVLDDQDSSYTNISREDIQIYLRTNGYSYNVLKQYQKRYENFRYLYLDSGLNFLQTTQQTVFQNTQNQIQKVNKWCQYLVNLIEKKAQSQKSTQNLLIDSVTNLFQYMYGIDLQKAFLIPLVPSLSQQLVNNINNSMKPYFTSINVDENQLSDIVPKLLNFVSIVFRYQNKSIVIEQQEQIKLGLQDDIDLQKQLLTLLQLVWVNKFVKLHYSRYNIKLYLTKIENIDEITFQSLPSQDTEYYIDSICKQIIKSTEINNYNIWRGYLKSHSQSVIKRSLTKYSDFQKCKSYQLQSSLDITLSYLNKLYHTKRTTIQPLNKLKQADRKILQYILNKITINNPVFVESSNSLYLLHIRDMKSTLRNILNSNRSYYKRLNMDLKVIHKTQSNYECEDKFLIDSNKQQRDKMDKLMKKSPQQFEYISLKHKKQKLISDQDWQKQLTKHSIYSYDSIKKVFFEGQQIPQLYVSSIYHSKKYILYDIAIKDLTQVQQRLLKTASKYISNVQGYIKVNQLEPLVDRYRLLHDLYEWELKYQYQKFKQIQILMQIYQHTVDPLNSYKIISQIFQLMKLKPRVDFDETYFESSYREEIEVLKLKSKVLLKTIDLIKNQEIGQTNQFHERLSKSIYVPYYQYGIYYEDLTGLQKLRKKQSQISQGSQLSFLKNNSSWKKKTQNDMVEQQSEQQEQEDVQYLQLKKYDEYLLSKDLQQVFDQISGNRNQIQTQANREQVNEPNKIIHKKAEGGPNFLMKLKKNANINIENKIQFTNFFEHICYSLNVIQVINQSIKKTTQMYCKNHRTLYQIFLEKNILDHVFKMLLSTPQPNYQIEKQINSEIKWDQSYHFVVKASKLYRQTMKNSLDPPSSLANTLNLPKFIEALPHYSELQFLDIHSLSCLLQQKRPNNTILYRQIFLAFNLLEAFDLTKTINRTIMQRQNISFMYKRLGKSLYVQVLTNVMQNIKQLSFVIEQLKLNDGKLGINMVFPDALQKLRLIAESQKTNVINFLSTLKYHQRRARTVLLLNKQMKMFVEHKRYFLNGVMQPQRISIHLNNIKALNSRVKPIIGFISSQFRDFSYLKSKSRILTIYQQYSLKYRESFEHSEEKSIRYLNQKRVWLINQNLTKLFFKDMQKAAQKRTQFLQITEYNEILSKKTKTLPFGKLFNQDSFVRYLQQKFYYDQKNISTYIGSYGKIFDMQLLIDPFYLHTIQQLFSEYYQPQQSNCLQSFDLVKILSQIQKEILISKNQVFKRIMVTLPLEKHQSKSLQFLCELNMPISGSLTVYNKHKVEQLSLFYKGQTSEKKLLQYYRSLNEYIDANIVQIAIACEDVSLLKFIIKLGKDFEEVYPMIDSNELYENLDRNILATMYVYEVKQYEIMKKAKQSTSQNVVIDQLIDFFIRRVQGLGLVRQLFLPFIQEFKNIKEQYKDKKQSQIIQFFKLKTKNIYKLIHLGILQCYKNTINTQFINKLEQLFNDIFNPFQYSCLSENQSKINISKMISDNLQQRYRFNNKVPNSNNIINKLHYSIINSPLNFDKYIVGYVSQYETSYKYFPTRRNSIKSQQFLNKILATLQTFGQTNRLKIMAHLKFVHQNNKDMLLLKKQTQLMKLEQAKQKFFDIDIQNNILINATINLNQQCFNIKPLNANSKLFNKLLSQIQTKTIVISNNYQQYLQFKKLILTKQQKDILSTPIPLKSKQWIPRQLDIYRNLLKKILFNKLSKQTFKTTLVNYAIDIIQKQRIQINQPTKVVNINLVPRVKLNSCYSSPLRQARKTYISDSYKIAFVQAFINRLRNKVSRVDLLSSGYGFVITVADLENCVNFLNKSLFSFTQKQFKYRMDTFGLYWQMMIQSLNLKNKQITQLKLKLKYLNARVDNINETSYIKKASVLLHQNNKLNMKLRQIQRLSQGLEDRTRKVVELQYHNEIKQLNLQNQMLRNKFKQFQNLLVILAKDETRNSFNTLINEFKTKTSDIVHRNIDYSGIGLRSQKQKQTKQKHKDKQIIVLQKQEQKHNFMQEEDYTYQKLKLLNKMRAMNILKIATQKQKQYKQQERLKSEIYKLKSVHDTSVVKSEKQLMIRKQLDNIQIQLSHKLKQLENYKTKCQSLESQNSKLKTWKINKQRVIQNLKNSVIHSTNQHQSFAQTRRSQAKSQIIPSAHQNRSLNKKQIIETKSKEYSSSARKVKPFSTQPLLVDTSYQLSNKDASWKQKCQQLFIQNKKMQKILQKMKIELMTLQNQKSVRPSQQDIIYEYSKQQSFLPYQKTPSSKRKRFPNLNFKYKMSGHQI